MTKRQHKRLVGGALKRIVKKNVRQAWESWQEFYDQCLDNELKKQAMRIETTMNIENMQKKEQNLQMSMYLHRFERYKSHPFIYIILCMMMMMMTHWW